MPTVEDSGGPVGPQLGLWDTVSIILGIVVGVAIFEAPRLVAGNVSAPWEALAAWGLGGLLALVGALCYAELATTYPRSGGDYIYLTRAYGRWAGFLFGWAQLIAILTGSIGALSYVFAEYAVDLFGIDRTQTVVFAAVAIGGLTLVNCFGLVAGKATQNILTAAKICGVSLVLVAGLIWGTAADPPALGRSVAGAGFGMAMVFVLYAYGGWNDAVFVTSEVRDRQTNLPLALLLGTVSVTILYMLLNVAFLKVLGFEGLRQSRAPAAEVLKLAGGPRAAQALSLLVMVSALSAVSGMILTGSRLYAALGSEHRLFSGLGRWHPRLGAPIWSLIAQATVALSMIGAVGTDIGRATINWSFQSVGLEALDWQRFDGGFGTLVACTAPVFWFFFLLTGLSVFVLRWKDDSIERPCPIPFYPLPALVFCGMCVYMLWSSVSYVGGFALLGIVPLLVGLPLYMLEIVLTRKSQAAP